MKLSKAKVILIQTQPFFASILLSLKMIHDDTQPTMATNGDYIKFNQAFLDAMTLNETVFVLAHETLHCIFQHMHRRGKRNAMRWNIAADYLINEILTRERIGDMPKGCLLDYSLTVQGKTTEGIYDLLPESPQ